MAKSWYFGKRVFLTGHTGFKGAWLCRVLVDLGAQVTGYALPPPEGENLFELCGVAGIINNNFGDIRDFNVLQSAFDAAAPEVVIHMAAQPLVRESYKNPRYTYETNVMGTVNLLECVRLSGKPCSVVVVTTDKVYQNHEWAWGYRENDILDGYDPYANSKSCAELAVASYKRSFFPEESGVIVSTARAGNVIGGGDFSADRIVPDCFSAARAGKPIAVRNPAATRPYQHVLEPLLAYLKLAEMQSAAPELAGSYNIGPDDADCASTKRLVEQFCAAWGGGQTWQAQGDGGPHESNFLKLDCSQAKTRLNWHPHWHLGDAIKNTVEWYKCYLDGGDIAGLMDAQIHSYTGEDANV